MRRLLIAVAVAVGACNADTAPRRLSQPVAVPIPADYKSTILAWAKRYYVEPSSLRGARISDPVPIRLITGSEVWLVCLEVDARARGGGPLGAQRVALGLARNLFIAPVGDRSPSGKIRIDQPPPVSSPMYCSVCRAPASRCG